MAKMGGGGRVMKCLSVGVVLLLALGALTACGGATAATSETGNNGGASYTSAVLSQSYEGALDVPTQMALGTLQLEGTPEAVIAEQAVALLPLWQALQGGVTAEMEVNAVLKQIEGTMTQEQLEAIAAMQLTQEDLQAWIQEQGPGARAGFPGGGQGEEVSPEVRATRQAEFGEREIPPEMATRRAEFGNMSEEERAAMRATLEAGGDFRGGEGGRAGGAPAGGSGGGAPGGERLSFQFLLAPLVRMLEARAGEG
jgi:hypothetical protein